AGAPAPRRRRLGGGAASCGGDDSHPHEVLFFLMWAIGVGAFIASLMMLKLFKREWLQQTVVLFILGVLYSGVMEKAGLKDDVGAVGRSFSMWMCIDPHLLLYTMLPPLLAGDAMGIDTRVAFKVAKQCFYLAGPGVLVNASLTAVALQSLHDEWPWWLCMTAGAILCATDPVAVVSLLKELGASPTLTVQIQGESLLNDGTAIVLYSFAYAFLSKKDTSDPGNMVLTGVAMTLYSWGVGFAIGIVYWLWIWAVNSKFHHQSAVIQIALTLACAYSSFLVAEGLLHLSGVLATVSSSLVLAHNMWPHVQNHHTMHTVWHMFEYLGNTIIFFLAGALTGQKLWSVTWGDWMNLGLIYVAITVIRGLIMFCSRPLLTVLHADRAEVSVADCMVMTWGGLRGAVGLALAIQVSIDRAADDSGHEHISEEDADRVLFYVGGVALLTLIINATTCPSLVKKLGLTKTPEAKMKLMSLIGEKIHRHMQTEIACQQDVTPRVTRKLSEMLHDMDDHLHHVQGSDTTKDTLDVLQAVSRGPARASLVALEIPTVQEVINERPEKVYNTFEAAARLWSRVDEADRKAFRNLFDAGDAAVMAPFEARPEHAQGLLEDMRLSNGKPDAGLIRAVNDSFLSMLKADYKRQQHEGLVSNAEAKVLIDSITAGMSRPAFDLWDFKYICQSKKLAWSVDADSLLRPSPGEEESKGSNTQVALRSIDESKKQTWRSILQELPIPKGDKGFDLHKHGWLESFVEGAMFQAVVIFVVIANSIFVNIEAIATEGQESVNGGWLVTEVVFNAFFTVEFVVKLAILRARYFGAWNCFDMLLVFMGWGGIIAELVLVGSGVGTQEAQLTKGARSLKTLRALRLVRLVRLLQEFHFRYTRGVESCGWTEERLGRLSVAMAFVRAHSRASAALLEFFGGGDGEACLLGGETFAGCGVRIPNLPEVSRCVLQSMTAVCQAMVVGSFEVLLLPPWLLREKAACHQSIETAAALEKFIEEAREDGVLNAKEAHSMVHPMHDYLRNRQATLDNMRFGRFPHTRRSTIHSDDSQGMRPVSRRNSIGGDARSSPRLGGLLRKSRSRSASPLAKSPTDVAAQASLLDSHGDSPREHDPDSAAAEASLMGSPPYGSPASLGPEYGSPPKPGGRPARKAKAKAKKAIAQTALPAEEVPLEAASPQPGAKAQAKRKAKRALAGEEMAGDAAAMPRPPARPAALAAARTLAGEEMADDAAARTLADEEMADEAAAMPRQTARPAALAAARTLAGEEMADDAAAMPRQTARPAALAAARTLAGEEMAGEEAKAPSPVVFGAATPEQ
ncbi:unnamed protein product, partial [Prorocentrum cordatum]